MLSSSIKIFLLILFLFTFANAQTPVPEDTPEKIFTEEIKLNISAFDREGKFAGNVKKEDLVINEDGRLHQADSLRRTPANVLIVLDTGGEMRSAKSFDQTRSAARSLINALQPDDAVAIMDYHDKVEIVAEWTNKINALDLLDKKTNFGRRSMFYQAIDAAINFLRKTPTENRHLVLITDGTDSFDNPAERAQALQKLLSTDANVHVISYTKMELVDIEPRSKGISKTPPKKAMPDEVRATLPNGVRDPTGSNAGGGISINTDKEFMKKIRARKNALVEAEKYLSEISADTNGEFILPDSNEEMLAKTALVAAVIDSSYVLTYTPKRPLSESKAGEIRSIEVTSRRPGLDVQAKRKLIVEPDNK